MGPVLRMNNQFTGPVYFFSPDRGSPGSDAGPEQITK
jgi:hypothetical protein